MKFVVVLDTAQITVCNVIPLLFLNCCTDAQIVEVQFTMERDMSLPVEELAKRCPNPCVP